jgi:hypothetical protein
MVRRLKKLLDYPTVTVDWTRIHLPHWILLCPLLDLPRCKRLNQLHPCGHQTTVFPTPTSRPRLILTRLTDLDRCCQMFPPDPTLRQWLHGLNLTHRWHIRHMAAWSITPLCKRGLQRFTSKSTQLAISQCVLSFVIIVMRSHPNLPRVPPQARRRSRASQRGMSGGLQLLYWCLTMQYMVGCHRHILQVILQRHIGHLK